MLLNKKAVRQYFHERGKRISKESWIPLELKVKSLLDRTISASNTAKTIEPRDINNFIIKLNT